jgi:nucleotide-binding universal stress UspA family protein
MSASEDRKPLIVGVYPGQNGRVVLEAALIADELGLGLICAYVEFNSYLTEWGPAPGRREASLHPTNLDGIDERVALDLAESIRETLGGAAQSWQLRILAGDPPKALARLADEVDARLLAVGTRSPGFARTVGEGLAGSVATRLSHTQPRPVLVIPVDHEAANALLLAATLPRNP